MIDQLTIALILLFTVFLLIGLFIFDKKVLGEVDLRTVGLLVTAFIGFVVVFLNWMF